jgi:hypothetical protein
MSLEGCNDDYTNKICGDNDHLWLDELRPDCCNSTTGCADTFKNEVCVMQQLPKDPPECCLGEIMSKHMNM